MEPGEYDNIAAAEAGHWWYVGMREIAAGLLTQVCPPLAPGHAESARDILDAGCGVGGGLRWLSAYGQVTGIDLHPLAIRYSAQVSRRLSQASVQALPFCDQSFDLVTSFEVLYHLAVSDDCLALAEMARVLRPGGWLLVRVPAHDWMRGAHDRLVHTRHRYGRAELERKLLEAGFRLSRLTGVGVSLLLPAIVRRAVQRGQGAKSDVVVPPPALNSLLLAVLRAEGRWLNRFDLPAGLSLLALAQKPSQTSTVAP
jgi:SAM-dependent methyltransferase